ncbi:MAG: hypothetical protein AAGF11_31735 [Myxococcota bacterium]
MVSRTAGRLSATAGLLALPLLVLSGVHCKVPNEDHCANQDVPGNEYCLSLSLATPYCSPCRRQFHGCVNFEPFSCAGYIEEIATSTGTGTGTGTASGTGTGSATDMMTSGVEGSAGPMTSS